MPFKQPPELHELQSDVLGVSLIDNPHLPGSPIPSKNKALKTSKPYVTGAINELLQTIENIRNLAQTSLSQQQAVLGDFVSDSTLISNLQKIDSSVLKAIIKLSKEIEGDINDPQDISAIAPSIKEAILKLSATTMAQPESAYEIWLELGNTGTKEDFLNSLKGKDGKDGVLTGPSGTTATIEIGKVETGTAAAVQNVGTDKAAKFNFTIPRGEKGLIGNIILPGPADDEIITCNIEDLQAVIDSLPRFLNKNITIKTNPGIFAQDIYLENFFGYGSIYLLGADTIAETHQLNSVNVFRCRTSISVAGFDLLAEAFNIPTWQFSVQSWNNSATVELKNLNITKGVRTHSANQGIGSTHAYTKITSCNISNKHVAINAQRGMVTVDDIRGSGNNVCFLAYYAGILQKYGACTLTGSVLNQNSPGCILVD